MVLMEYSASQLVLWLCGNVPDSSMKPKVPGSNPTLAKIFLIIKKKNYIFFHIPFCVQVISMHVHVIYNTHLLVKTFKKNSSVKISELGHCTKDMA